VKEEKIVIKSDFKLDIESKIPYYYQLKQFMVEQISSGSWKPSHMLPYEHQLCQHFSVSRTVIRQTLLELKNEGYIVTKKGKGTYIVEPEISENITQNLFGFFESWTSQGFKVENVVLDLKKMHASSQVASVLKLDSKNDVIFLKRLSKLNDKPYSINMNYLPYKNLKNLLFKDFRFKGLSTILGEKYNITLPYVKSSIEITLATKEEAELLNIKKGDPLFLIEGISFSKDQIPMVFFHVVHIGLRTKIRVELNETKVYKRSEKFPSSTTVIWDSK
jgi:GntR family transcriptional regulator